MMMRYDIIVGEEGGGGLIQVADIPADNLGYGVTNSTVDVAFQQQDPDDELATNISFANVLVFRVKDCDFTTGEADPVGYY